MGWENEKHQPRVRTGDPNFAAALHAVGIPLDPRQPEVTIISERDGKPQTCWIFLPVSECGRFTAKMVQQVWGDLEWIRNNPENPLAYAMATLMNRHRFIDNAKTQAVYYEILNGNSMALIRANAPQAKQDAILARIGK